MNFNENCEVFWIFKSNRHTERSEVSKMDTLALNSWIFPLRYAQGQNDKVWRFFKENSKKFKEFCGFCKKNSRNLRIFQKNSKNFH